MNRPVRTSRPIPPKVLAICLTVVLLAIAAFISYRVLSDDPNVTDFDSCVAAGSPVMESYPEQCAYQGQTFVNPRQSPQPLDP